MSCLGLCRGQTIFLDRDGTINQSPEEGKYITRPEELCLLPGAAKAIRILNENEITVVVVTNQRGVSLGLMTEEDLREIHNHLHSLLSAEGARIDHILYCPHAFCHCRKPGAGLLWNAAKNFPEVQLQGAIIIGDSANDIGAGRAAGIESVRLGKTAPDEPQPNAEKPTLLEAILSLTEEAP